MQLGSVPKRRCEMPRKRSFSQAPPRIRMRGAVRCIVATVVAASLGWLLWLSGSLPSDAVRTALESGGSHSTELDVRFPFAKRSHLALNMVLFEAKSEDGFSLPQLLKLCTQGSKNFTTITRHWAIEATQSDPHTIDYLVGNYLKVCYPLEISSAARTMGFCSDWIPYIYHSHARLAPVLRSEDYLAKRVLCPKSSFLHGEHTTLELFDDVLVQRMNNTIVTRVEQLTNRHLGPLDYIPAVRNYWMPNVERVNHEQVSLFRLTYKVLCKTKITCNATHQYVLNNRIYPRPHFKFMAHTSPDAWQDAHDLFGAEELARLMTLRSYDAFLHAFGNTGSKRPHVVADCWTRHPEWPRLVLVGNPREMENYEAFRAKGWPPNVEFHEFVDVRTLRRLQIENGVALCSTAQEGYGHFINDGRSMGSVVLTTNHPPMNEFVREDGFDGILIGYDREPQHFDHQALWREFNSSVDISGTTVCDGVQRIISMSVEEKERMGGEARKSYELDTALMEANMKELLAEVWEHLQRDKSSLHRARYVY